MYNVSGNKYNSRLEITSTGISIRALYFIITCDIGFVSNYELSVFHLLELIVEFFFQTFHLIQEKIIYNSPPYSSTVSSVTGSGIRDLFLRSWYQTMVLECSWNSFDSFPTHNLFLN